MGTHWVERFDPDRLRAARKQRGISQEQLAERIGQRRVNYIKYESGVHKPRPRALKAIADALEVEIDELLRPGPTDMALLRARRGFSQTDVAALLNVSLSWYRRIEARQAAISPDLLERLAAILRASKTQLSALLLTRSGH